MPPTNHPLVGVVMGSVSDREKMQPAVEVLDKLGIPSETVVLSAHRAPDECAEYARTAAERGLRVLIAGAGWSAALPGVLAAHTLLPVIGVPLSGSPLGGQDALYSMIQMPPGVPVATVGIDTARNAAYLAARILALRDPALAQALADQREQARRSIVEPR
jgi:phosphoribosylaminoimidazole carboxylase PurE protein